MVKGTTALADILCTLCSVIFYVLIVAFVFVVGLEVFTDDGKIGNFYSNFHSSSGYTIPVEFTIEPEKPMLDNVLFSNYEEQVGEKGQKSYVFKVQYAKPIRSKDSLSFRTIVSVNNDWFKYNNYDLVSSDFRGEGDVYVKPKTLFNKVVIVFRTYLNLIFLMLTFFLLKNIFKTLRVKVEFSQKLYRLIKLLGLVLFSSVLLSVISNYLLRRALSDITINPLNYDLKYVDITMSPRLDFNFTILIVGLSLIVLSSLLNAGNRIQRENDLTV